MKTLEDWGWFDIMSRHISEFVHLDIIFFQTHIYKSSFSGRSAAWLSALEWGSRGRWFESSRPDHTNKGLRTFTMLALL